MLFTLSLATKSGQAGDHARVGETRAWADAHVDVGQLLARNFFLDMGSGIIFGNAVDAKGHNAFASEMFGREGHDGTLVGELAAEMYRPHGEFLSERHVPGDQERVRVG